MGKKSQKKNYVVLDSARVSYNELTDSIHLTAKDKGFEKGDPFHVVLSKGTTTENTLRKLLNKNGLIPDEKINTFPSIIRYNERGTRETVPEKIPLGVNRNGKEICWNTSHNTPHLAIVGPPGSGKSVVRKLIEQHTSLFPEYWDLYGVDFSGGLEMSTKQGSFKLVSHDFQSTLKLIESIKDTMHSRYKQMEGANITNYSRLPDKPKPMMLIMEEFNFLNTPTEQGNLTRDNHLQNEIYREKTLVCISDIARLGRAAGTHLVLLSQQDLEGELNANVGKMSFKAGARGRGELHNMEHHPAITVQAYYPSND